MTYLYTAAEYVRPWKLVTFVLGLLFLFAGAFWSGLPDWDVPVSVLMAIPAYITAPCTLRVFIERRWRYTHYAIFWTWFTVDGLYIVYWGLRDPAVVEALRFANMPASLALYALCGLVWYPKAPLHLVVQRLRLTRA